MIPLPRLTAICRSCRRPFPWGGSAGTRPTLCPKCRAKRVKQQEARRRRAAKLKRRKLRPAIIGKGFFDMVDENHICLRPDAGTWAGKVHLNKQNLHRIFDKHGTLVFYPSRRKTL